VRSSFNVVDCTRAKDAEGCSFIVLPCPCVTIDLDCNPIDERFVFINGVLVFVD
jgi:hypothetical protein